MPIEQRYPDDLDTEGARYILKERLVAEQSRFTIRGAALCVGVIWLMDGDLQVITNTEHHYWRIYIEREDGGFFVFTLARDEGARISPEEVERRDFWKRLQYPIPHCWLEQTGPYQFVVNFLGPIPFRE